MKTLVIYDSQFGNTAKIAHAIGEALRAYGDVAVLRVSEVRPEHWAGAARHAAGAAGGAVRGAGCGVPRDEAKMRRITAEPGSQMDTDGTEGGAAAAASSASIGVHLWISAGFAIAPGIAACPRTLRLPPAPRFPPPFPAHAAGHRGRVHSGNCMPMPLSVCGP